MDLLNIRYHHYYYYYHYYYCYYYLHENLRNDLDEENYDDIDENTFGDTNDSNCTLTPIICIDNSIESMKNGVKLPKSTQ